MNAVAVTSYPDTPDVPRRWNKRQHIDKGTKPHQAINIAFVDFKYMCEPGQLTEPLYFLLYIYTSLFSICRSNAPSSPVVVWICCKLKLHHFASPWIKRQRTGVVCLLLLPTGNWLGKMTPFCSAEEALPRCGGVGNILWRFLCL